jgi:phage terminase Nu1 subunit (DNA packaging protein)
MKLHEFQELIKAQRQAQQLTNLEKIATIIKTTEKENN